MEDSSLEEAFDAATQYVGAASTSGSLSNDQLLKFYGLYKQATVGSCNAPKPSFFDRKARAKWNAWADLGQLPGGEAQQQYIDLLTKLIPSWEAGGSSGGSSGGGKRGGAGGPVQSRMAEAVEDEQAACPDTTPPLLQAARAGDVAAVEALLQGGSNAEQRGSEGETALHWAADRGHEAVISLLLKHGADVNATDSDGLTACHYAALAEQRGAAELLAGWPGVQLGLRSADGEAAADVAPASWAFLLASDE